MPNLIVEFVSQFERTKKSLGQHFLTNGHYIKKIVEACRLEPNEPVLEIGPGSGALTAELLKITENITAVELDINAAKFLTLHLPKVKIVNSDILNVNLSELFVGKFTIAGNLPYNLAAKIFTYCTGYRKSINRMVFMFQKEAADRITAKPKSRQYSSVSVFAGYYYNVRKVCDIGGGNFFPKTKVESTVLEFMPIENSSLPKDRETDFFRFVKSAFAHKRKTLKNNIPDITGCLEKLGINGNIRAEELSITEFLKIYKEVLSLRP